MSGERPGARRHNPPGNQRQNAWPHLPPFPPIHASRKDREETQRKFNEGEIQTQFTSVHREETAELLSLFAELTSLSSLPTTSTPISNEPLQLSSGERPGARRHNPFGNQRQNAWPHPSFRPLPRKPKRPRRNPTEIQRRRNPDAIYKRPPRRSGTPSCFDRTYISLGLTNHFDASIKLSSKTFAGGVKFTQASSTSEKKTRAYSVQKRRRPRGLLPEKPRNGTSNAEIPGIQVSNKNLTTR